MLIPKMLLVCIKNERGLSYKKLNKYAIIFARCRKRATPEELRIRYAKISKAKKKYWATTPKATLKKMCKKRAKSLKKYLNGLTKEELRARTANAKAKLLQLHKDPIEGPRLKAIDRAQAAKINNAVTEELPRINTYSGVISLKDLENL